MDTNFLKVRAPAKLILSGEHSVVYGHPAIAMAVNRYTIATARWTSPLHFSFNLMGIDFKRRVTLHTLRKLKHKLKDKYHQYHLGHVSIRDVLKKPFELSLFTVINVLDKLKEKLPRGIDIATESNIPIGCGMGSSAASVVSIVHAVTKLLDIDLNLEDYVKLGIESENLQHGYSSGLDVHTVYHGGSVWYQNGQFQTRTLPHCRMMIVQTGQPNSSTGECVAHAAQYFKNGKMGDDFAAVTHALDLALQQNNLSTIQECIRTNHRLLNTIGVVPNKINEFIVDLEKSGAAAKICGAGSVRGNEGGIVLVVSETDVTAIAQQYGYPIIPIHPDTRGTCVI